MDIESLALTLEFLAGLLRRGAVAGVSLELSQNAGRLSVRLDPPAKKPDDKTPPG